MLTNCPNCGAPIFVKYVACPYCDTPYDVAETYNVMHIELNTKDLVRQVKQTEINRVILDAMRDRRERRKSILYADDKPIITIED